MSRALVSLIAVCLFGSICPSLQAQQRLNEEALFRRCYAHLTQMRPRLEDPLLAQVKSGSKTAQQVCQEVFDSARLTANNNTTISDTNNAVAKAVFRTFHELHRSWSREQVLFDSVGDGSTITGAQAAYDDAPMGSYVTRALLSPAHNVDSVTHGTEFLRPVRTNMAPTSYNGTPNTTVGQERDWTLGTNHPLAPRGDLLGIQSLQISPIFLSAPTRFTSIFQVPDFPNLIAPPAQTLNIPRIEFADNSAVRNGLPESDFFGIWIRGTLMVPTEGSYTFFLNVDQAGELFIDGRRIISRGGPGKSSASPLTLTAGNHAITVTYYEQTGAPAPATSRLTLTWRGPSIPAEVVVPDSAFSGLIASYHTHFQQPPQTPTGSEGGGFIGNHNYLLTTFTEMNGNYVPDGGLATNRSWARAVFSDALCREIPVIRESDAAPFVIPNSQLPFRQTAACNTCHASIDRQAGLIKTLRYNHARTMFQTSPLPDLIGILGMRLRAPLLPENPVWSDVPDTLYYPRQAPYGHFFMRNIKGELVDQVVRSFEDLGAAIRGQDDYYACFAKRYYYYFTGIDVPLGDPGDVTYPQLNAVDTRHRDKVLALGNRLKSSKSLSQLVFDIIGSDEYRLSDYGVKGAATK